MSTTPLVAGLGLINSQTPPDTEEARAGRREMSERVHSEGSRAAAEAAIPELFSRRSPAREELAQFAAKGAEQAGVDGIAWALEAMARRPDRSSVETQSSQGLEARNALKQHARS